jgi:hypothetical protein
VVANYAGPVVVVDHEGNEHDVRAMLHATTQVRQVGGQRVEGLSQWSGALAGSAPWWDMSQASVAVTVRLPSGREGSVLLGDFDVTNELGPVTVSGTGDAPFG